MRRLTVIAILGLLMGVVGPPASAMKYEHFNAPARVGLDDDVVVRVFDCEDGPTWKAYVVAKVIQEGEWTDRKRRRAQFDLETLSTKTRIWFKSPFSDFISDRGVLALDAQIVVKCIHHFDGGGRGVFFREVHDILVVG